MEAGGPRDTRTETDPFLISVADAVKLRRLSRRTEVRATLASARVCIMLTRQLIDARSGREVFLTPPAYSEKADITT
jgi:hypothetical protein